MTTPTTTLGELAHAAISTQVAALLAHESAARTGDDVEAVHQMRVATRRLRAALQVFADAVPADVNELRGELGWLADALGAVRDLDVQSHHIRAIADELHAPSEALAPIQAWFQAGHTARRRELVEALDSARYSALLGALNALVAAEPGAWLTGSAPRPMVEAMPDLIRGRYRRFRKAARDSEAETPSPVLHKARIRAKQLRYSIEFVGDLYGTAGRAMVKRATNLQDVLGAIQDAAVLTDRLQAVPRAGHELPPASLFFAGQLTERIAHEAATARTQVARARRRVTGRAWTRLQRRFSDLGKSAPHSTSSNG